MTKTEKPWIIRDLALELLTEVVGHSRAVRQNSSLWSWVDCDRDDEGAVTRGHSYGDILTWVQDEFPSGRTTLGSLRWYASRIREQDPDFMDFGDLPQYRPRTRHPQNNGVQTEKSVLQSDLNDQGDHHANPCSGHGSEPEPLADRSI